MKTIHTLKLMLTIVLTSIIIASCSKDESGPVNSTTSAKVGYHSAAIFDKGVSDAGLRQMQVVLSNQNYNFYNSNSSVSLNDTLLSVLFYSELDNQVPSGIYKFSDTPDKGPFTFGNGMLYLQSSDYSGSLPVASIVSGSVNVSNKDSQYDITFQCILSTGEKFRSEFHGGMTYIDAHQ